MQSSNWSNMWTPWATDPAQTNCSTVGSSPQAAVPAQSLLLFWLSMGYSLLQVISTCYDMGSSMSCGGIPAPPWYTMSCRGTVCSTMVFSMGYRETSTLAPRVPLPLPFSLTLLYTGLFLYTFSHFSLPAAVAQAFFFLFKPFLKYALTEAQPVLLTGSALPSSRSFFFFEMARTGSYLIWGSFWNHLTEATSAASCSLWKPRQINPMHPYRNLRINWITKILRFQDVFSPVHFLLISSKVKKN